MPSEKVTNKEYKVITKALFELLASCNVIPNGIPVKYQTVAETESIGLITLPGAKYMEKYIDGGFKAQMPFQISYKAKATTNGQMMESQRVLDGICDWLEAAEFPNLTDKREIEEVTVNSTTYVTEMNEAGYVVYARTGSMVYEKEE